MMVAFNYPLSILAYQLGEKIFTFYQKSRLNNEDFREKVGIIVCWYSVLYIFPRKCSAGTLLPSIFRLKRFTVTT